MNRIEYSYYRIEEHILKRKHLIRFYFTRQGLKNVGASRMLGSRPLVPIEVINISPYNLFLGPDFLKDNYTLLDRCLIDSPHFGLMQAMNAGLSLMETDYMQRYIDGTLDWRRGVTKPKNSKYFYKKFNESKTSILAGKTSPVITYRNGGKIYLFDGKHRAALYAVLGFPVKCMVVGSEIANADMWHYMFSLIQEEADFSKHSHFHSVYIKEVINNE